jgi:hypothetical protein
MTQKAMPPMGATNPDASPGAMPAPEATTALKEGIVSGARDIGAEVKHIASDVAVDAKRAAESKLGAGKDFAAEHLGAVAYALRHTSQQLRSEDSGITDYVEKAASSVDNVSHYLQTRTLSQLIGDVEGFARREPAVFLGGAFFAGLIGGRFLKSATPSLSAPGSSQATRDQAQSRRPAQGNRNGSSPQLGQGSEPARTASTRTPANGDKHGSQTSASSPSSGTSKPAGGSSPPPASKTEPPSSTRSGKGPGVS